MQSNYFQATRFNRHLIKCINRSNPRRIFDRKFSSPIAAASTNGPTFDDKVPPPSVVVDTLICGGGIAGASVAYHLAKRGIKDILLLEQGRIGGGVTWLSGGLMSSRHLWQHSQVHDLASYSSILARSLSETYADIAHVKCGRLLLAQSDANTVDLRRTYALARAHGYDARLMQPKEAKDLCPALNIDGIKVALLVGDDARLNLLAFCRALTIEARNQGAKIVENCRVHSLKVGDNGRVYGAETDQGFVQFKNFVNAAGLWATSIPMEGIIEHPVKIPSQSCYYSQMIAKPCEGVPPNIPIIHDLDDNVYLSNVTSSSVGVNYPAILCGGFEETAVKPTFTKIPPPRDFNFQELPDDWDLFFPILDKLTKRFPAMANAEVEKLITSAECYTPDGYVLVGQVPQVPNYYTACGMNGVGASWAGGVGRLLADWIVDGQPPQDVSKIDVARLLEMHSNKYYLTQRVPEVVSHSFRALMPTFQCGTARNLRTSPVHERLRAAGGVFGEIMGYERPLYFGREKENPPFVGEDNPVGRPAWFSFVKSEYEACRERVGIMDMSNFSKLELVSHGDEVVRFLQKLCSANVDKPVGSTIFTGMQNEQGGYVTDCTISRLGKSHFFIVAPTVQQVRLRLWLERHVHEYPGVNIQDVTSMYTALNIIGPSSRHLLQDLTDDSLSSTDFPAFSAKEISVGYASNVKAISVTHCGELGWVLYIPNEFAQHVYERIVEAGRSYGLQHAGYYTLRQLRIEKFYVYWGMDIDLTTTPTECGRLFRVNFEKEGGFIGREALLRERDTGVRRRYVQLLVDKEKHDLNSDPWPQGGEPIYRNGKFCGSTTTAAYGFTLGCQVCIGYIQHLDDNGQPQLISTAFVSDKDAEYEIDIANKLYPVKVNLHSPSIPMMSSEHPQHYRPTQ